MLKDKKNVILALKLLVLIFITFPDHRGPLHIKEEFCR